MKIRRSSVTLEQTILSTNSNQLIRFETQKLVVKKAVIDVHLPSKCQVIPKERFYCKKKGHTIKVCWKCKNSLSRNETSNATNAVDDVYIDELR